MVVSNTESRDSSPGGRRGYGGMGVRNNHHWRMQWCKQDLRGSRNTSQGGRTRSRSILQRGRLWTSVSGPLGGRGRGCLGGGGNRPA